MSQLQQQLVKHTLARFALAVLVSTLVILAIPSTTTTAQESNANTQTSSENAGSCEPTGSFFGLPTWYKYLDGEVDPVDPAKCVPKADIIKNPNQLWGIGLAIFDILLRLAGLVAVAFVIYGGFLYIVSQGESDKAASAKNTIMNALIGLVIVIISTAVISFLGNSL